MGDAIALALVHLHARLGKDGRTLLPDGPRRVKVVDFGERMLNSINQFAYARDLKEPFGVLLR